MIGLFDSGHGGLTILNALQQRFPQASLVYFGDHARAPYGNRDSETIVEWTREGVEALFKRGSTLVVLACNTATAVATRTLQQEWLPNSQWRDRNILGIVAPTVEAATQVSWAVTTPQYPQKYNDDTIAVFATSRTVNSQVYADEILKRCPKMRVIQTACAELAGSIESGADDAVLQQQIQQAVTAMLAQAGGDIPHRAILGCTHFPLVEAHFKAALPATTRLYSQPEIVADSLENYLERHPQYCLNDDRATLQLITSGELLHVNQTATRFWPSTIRFEAL